MSKPTPDQNPYDSPRSDRSPEEQPLPLRAVSTPRRRSMFLVFSAVVATVPLCGYFVNGGRDPQWIALVIIPAWLLTLVLVVTSIVLAVALRLNSLTERICWIGFSIYILIAALAGWGGVQKTFYELLAG